MVSLPDKDYAERQLDVVRKRYCSFLVTKTAADSVTADEVEIIKDIIYGYPKVNVAGDVLMPYGIQNNRNELPFNKEYLTAVLYQNLTKERLILLPRYMDAMLNRIVGEGKFINYSLSDGISALSEDGRTFEFKMFGWDNHNDMVKQALEKADIGIGVTRTSPKKLGKFARETVIPAGKTLYVISIASNGKLIDAIKIEASPKGESPVTKIQWSRLNPDQNDLSSIEDYIRRMPAVNINDQTPMDYSLIQNSEIYRNSSRAW